MGEFRVHTQEEIDAVGSTRAELATLGVSWPPVQGWRRRLLLGLDPNTPDETIPIAIWERLNDGTWGIRVRLDSGLAQVGASVPVRHAGGTESLQIIRAIVRVGDTYAHCEVQFGDRATNGDEVARRGE